MNRETKRMLQKQGQLGEDGEPKVVRRAPAPKPPKETRTKPRQFLREVRGELRKVAWPTREETIKYSIVVLIVLVILTGAIAVIDLGMSKFVLWIYK
jgi:preprotein translocase subunit SecE